MNIYKHDLVFEAMSIVDIVPVNNINEESGRYILCGIGGPVTVGADYMEKFSPVAGGYYIRNIDATESYYPKGRFKQECTPVIRHNEKENNLTNILTTDNEIKLSRSNNIDGCYKNYCIKDNNTGRRLLDIHLQEGDPQECGLNGISVKSLLLVAVAEIEQSLYQEHGSENITNAIERLKEAAFWLDLEDRYIGHRNILAKKIIS